MGDETGTAALGIVQARRAVDARAGQARLVGVVSDDWADERGVDWDLRGCLSCNPQGFAESDIARVLAVVEGEQDGDDWHWLIWLKDGRYAYVVGGCDYTGWDCQSSAQSWFSDSALGALLAGTRAGWESERFDARRAELRRQLVEGKAQTARERVGEDLNA